MIVPWKVFQLQLRRLWCQRSRSRNYGMETSSHNKKSSGERSNSSPAFSSKAKTRTHPLQDRSQYQVKSGLFDSEKVKLWVMCHSLNPMPQDFLVLEVVSQGTGTMNVL